jgi:hypothetical protein
MVVGAGAALTWRIGDSLFRIGFLADRPALWGVFVLSVALVRQVVGFVVVAAWSVYAVAEIHAGRRPHLRKPPKVNKRHFGRMVRALARPFLVIAMLGLVPFGIVLAAIQYVRYIFIPQAVMIERTSGADARAASARASHGRWLKTGSLAAILTILIAIPSPLVGILLLVFAGRSLEFVNLASGVVYAVVVPFVFVAATLYYLDHRPQTTANEPQLP